MSDGFPGIEFKSIWGKGEEEVIEDGPLKSTLSILKSFLGESGSLAAASQSMQIWPYLCLQYAAFSGPFIVYEGGRFDPPQNVAEVPFLGGIASVRLIEDRVFVFLRGVTNCNIHYAILDDEGSVLHKGYEPLISLGDLTTKKSIHVASLRYAKPLRLLIAM